MIYHYRVPRQRRRLAGASQIRKMLATDPFAFWPLNESSGSTAHCFVNADQNGTYTGVTLANGFTPWGGPCPFFDGLNDSVEIFSSALASAFDPVNGSLAIWSKVANASVWADAQYRRMIKLYADTDERCSLRKTDVANTAGGFFSTPGNSDTHDITAGPSTDWQFWVLVWNSNPNTYLYKDGSLVSGPMTPGTWVTALTAAKIGIENTGASMYWSGWLAHGAIWDRPLTADEIVSLARY